MKQYKTPFLANLCKYICIKVHTPLVFYYAFPPVFPTYPLQVSQCHVAKSFYEALKHHVNQLTLPKSGDNEIFYAVNSTRPSQHGAYNL